MDGTLRVIQRLTRACVYISNPSPIIVLEESLPLLFPQQQQQRGLRTFSLDPHPLTVSLPWMHSGRPSMTPLPPTTLTQRLSAVATRPTLFYPTTIFMFTYAYNEFT